MRRTDNVGIPVRDGTVLMADVFQPDAEGRFPALLSFSPYPRQIQDLGAPLGFIEAGASDFFVPRGYAHIKVNARGTGGSGGTWTLADPQERDDLYDLIEWIAAQPWCDGNVGMLGLSYFAISQLGAAVTRPPHLKAIVPFLTTDDLYDAVWHNGLLSSGFISAWLPAIGVMSERPDSFWRSKGIDLVREVLSIPAIHSRMQHINGEAIVAILRTCSIPTTPSTPSANSGAPRQWSIPRATPSGMRAIRARLLGSVDIPVYLAADWDNVPLHLPSTFTAWAAPPPQSQRADVATASVELCLALGSDALRGARLVRPLAQGHDTGIMDARRSATSCPARPIGTPRPSGRRRKQGSRPSRCAPTVCWGADEGEPGFREYLYIPAGSGQPSELNPPSCPRR
ncbi:MAG: CocE/NonD family hydrolase [Hyphomicrobium sp.]